MDVSMKLKIEKVLSSRLQGGGDEQKVRIKVVYHKRLYKKGPVPGGFVVDTSFGYFSAFTVDLRNDIDQSLRTKFFNVLFSLRYDHDHHLQERLINETTSALVSLPDPMILNGVKIMPELFVQIDLELHYTMWPIQRSPLTSYYTTPTTTTSSSLTGRRRHNDIDYDDTRVLLRRWLMNNNRNAGASAWLMNNNRNAGESAILKKIKELERIMYMELEEENWRCSLCLESENREEEVLIRLGCKHVFHNNCIVKWIVKSNSCPLCRASV